MAKILIQFAYTLAIFVMEILLIRKKKLNQFTVVKVEVVHFEYNRKPKPLTNVFIQQIFKFGVVIYTNTNSFQNYIMSMDVSNIKPDANVFMM